MKGAARQTDLYTGFDGESEVDEFERWVEREYETPGMEIIANLLAGGRTGPKDWRRLIQFVAVQDMRTPLGFIQFVRRAREHIQTSLQHSIDSFADSIGLEDVREQHKSNEVPAGLRNRDTRNLFRNSFRIRIEPPSSPTSDQATVIAEVKSSRSLWMEGIRSLMAGPAVELLCSHRWSVATAHDTMEWPITDHPVLKLNFQSLDRYDFEGGYGNHGSEIMMPISPNALLYVQVGTKAANRFAFSEYHTQLLQQMLVERAFRWVFMRSPADWVTRFRPREVTPEKFAAEQAVLNQWHAEHSAQEARFHAADREPSTEA